MKDHCGAGDVLFVFGRDTSPWQQNSEITTAQPTNKQQHRNEANIFKRFFSTLKLSSFFDDMNNTAYLFFIQDFVILLVLFLFDIIMDSIPKESRAYYLHLIY